MLPGWLRNTTRQGILATPDSTYEWRRKGEHVKGIDRFQRFVLQFRRKKADIGRSKVKRPSDHQRQFYLSCGRGSFAKDYPSRSVVYLKARDARSLGEEIGHKMAVATV